MAVLLGAINSKRKKISKAQIKRNIFEPKKDFFMEKIDPYSYILHFTPSDAVQSLNLLQNKFDVERVGKGYYGSAYLVKLK